MDKVVSIIDKSFLQGSDKKNFLSIELAPGGFSYCILDSGRFEYKILESFSFGYPLDDENAGMAAEYLIQTNDVLQNEFERVSISFVSPRFILIPEELYDQSNKQAYTEFNIDHDDENYEIYSDKLNNLKAYSIYPAPVSVINMFSKYFPENRFRHYTTPLIESTMYNVNVKANKADIILHLNNGFFEVIIVEDSKLKLVKTFNFVTYDDLMYYVFYTLENVRLDAEKLNLLIVGNISIESELYRNIKLYFKSVMFGGRNDLYRYALEFDNIPHHYFYSLLNLNICG